MKIQKIKIAQFKILKNLEKEINGKNIFLVGENGVGKSSVMQFIEIALGKTTNIPENATGEGEVITNINGEDYHFHVKFKDGKPVITVTAPNGMKDTRKSFLKEIVGAIDFDIDQFVKLSESTTGRKKQVEIYKSLLPPDVIKTLDDMNNQVKRYYDDRTELNRKIDMLKGFCKESKMFGEDLNIQNVDVSFLQKEFEQISSHNQKIEKSETEIATLKVNGKRLSDEKQRLLDRLSEIENEHNSITKRIPDGEKWLSENKKIDTSEISSQIIEAANVNAKYSEAQQLKEKQRQINSMELQSGEFTALIDSSRQAISDAIKDMGGIVVGLSFDADNLIYNGIVVETSSLSASEIIHLGCKLKMAQNKDFGVLLIEHGESFGQKRWEEVQQMATDHDWQLIVEQVERGREELKIEIMGE